MAEMQSCITPPTITIPPPDADSNQLWLHHLETIQEVSAWILRVGSPNPLYWLKLNKETKEELQQTKRDIADGRTCISCGHQVALHPNSPMYGTKGEKGWRHRYEKNVLATIDALHEAFDQLAEDGKVIRDGDYVELAEGLRRKPN